MEQAERLLINLRHKSSEPGLYTSLTSNRHLGLAFAQSNEAFVAWLDFLAGEGLVETQGERRDAPNDLSFRLTLNGWRRALALEEVEASREAGFVAMAFRDHYEPVWTEAIEPAIRQAGWVPIRADREHHNDRIDDWILNQIRNARFLVAEHSDDNSGAAFEAGYALGLGRPVIWLAEQGAGDKGLHFDMRQYNHIFWSHGAENEILDALVERIINTVGRGPQATTT